MGNEISVKELAAAIAEAQRPMFDALGKGVAEAIEKGAKPAREEAINDLVSQAKSDPNAAKFLPMLLMTPSERQSVLDTEAKEARGRGAGLKFGRLARATALCRREYGGDVTRIPSILADKYGDKAFAEALTKSPMTSSDPAAGGFLGQETVASELIPLLRAQTFLGLLGARSYPMPTDKVHVPRMDAASSAGWIGETKPLPATSMPKPGRTTLSAKKLGAIVAISNDLLHDTSGAADAVVRDDMVKVAAIEINRTAVYGSGSEYEPTGLKNLGIQTHSTGARVDPDLIVNMLEVLWTANVPMLNPGILTNHKLRRDFMNLKSANGEYYYRAEMANNKLEGCNYAPTSIIPSGSDSNGLTDLIVGDWSEFFQGERTVGGVMIDSNDVASYYNGSTTRSAFQNLETLVRVVYVTDFLLRHQESFIISSDVWTKTP